MYSEESIFDHFSLVHNKLRLLKTIFSLQQFKQFRAKRKSKRMEEVSERRVEDEYRFLCIQPPKSPRSHTGKY